MLLYSLKYGDKINKAAIEIQNNFNDSYSIYQISTDYSLEIEKTLTNATITALQINPFLSPKSEDFIELLTIETQLNNANSTMNQLLTQCMVINVFLSFLRFNACTHTYTHTHIHTYTRAHTKKISKKNDKLQ